MEPLKIYTHGDINKAAEMLAQILVQAIDEKYAKRRKKAKSPDSPSKLPTSS